MPAGTTISIALSTGLTTAALVVAALGETSLDGRAPATAKVVPAVEASFRRESYRPGERARLVVMDPSPRLRMQIFRSGPERVPTRRDIDMHGLRVTPERTVSGGSGRRVLTVAVGNWESGLYFARLLSPDGRVGYAPFVVAPRHLGERRVAIVLPTLTWQAYNFRDEDADGLGDSWYVERARATVRLGRAHLNRGVPYGYRYHLGFLHWLDWTEKDVDYLSQWDLEHARSAAELAHAYDLIVFAGHHEYVTKGEYDLVEGYRDLGGNLLFLSANNFFWRVERQDDVIVRTSRWRDLRRPEAGLVGVQYVGHQRAPRGSWMVRRSSASPWIFAGTRLRAGSRFARGGVEIDQVTPASPDEIQVVAEIPDLFGPGMTAQMTYYRTSAGARVFAAGAFHFTRAVMSDPVVWRVLENLWARLSRD
jgi:hypothetical protein